MYGIVTEESLGSDPAALNANGGTLDVNPLLKAKYKEPDKPEDKELPDITRWDAAKAGFYNNSLTSLLYRRFEKPNFESVSGYDAQTKLAQIEKARGVQMPEDKREWFIKNTQSDEEAAWNLAQIQEREEDDKAMATYPLSAALGSMADPVSMVTSNVAGSIIRGLSIGAKLGTTAAMIGTVAMAAGIEGTLSATAGAVTPRSNADIALDALSGAVGGVFVGTSVAKPNFKMPTVAGGMIKGAGKGVPFDIKKYQSAYDEVAQIDKAFADSIFGDFRVNQGWSAASVQRNIHAAQDQLLIPLEEVYKKHELFSNSLSPSKRIAAKVKREEAESEATLWLHQKYRMEKLKDDVQVGRLGAIPAGYIDPDDMLPPANPIARELVDVYQNSEFASQYLKRLKQYGVQGSEDVLESNAYIPLKMTSDNLRKVLGNGVKPEDVAKALGSQLLANLPTALKKSQFIVEVGNSLLKSIKGTEFGDVGLKKFMQSIDKYPIERLLGGQAKAAPDEIVGETATNLRHRHSWDLDRVYTTDNGTTFTLGDLVDKNMFRNLNTYNMKMSSRTGIAAVGIKSGDTFSQKLDAFADAAIAKGYSDSYAQELTQYIKSSTLGEGVGDNISPFWRSMQIVAQGLHLKNSGIYNIGEYANLAWEHGIAKTIKSFVPALRKTGASSMNPKDAQNLLDIVSGRIAADGRIKPLITLMEDNYSALEEGMHQSIAYMGQYTRYLNASEFIRRHQIQMNASMMIQELESAVTGNAKSLSRMRELGIPDTIIDRLKKYTPNGKIDVTDMPQRLLDNLTTYLVSANDNVVMFIRRGERPRFMETTVGKVMFAYQSFVFAAHNKLARRALARDGALGMGMLLSMQMPLAIIAGMMANITSGKAPEDNLQLATVKAMSALGMVSLPLDAITRGEFGGSFTGFAPISAGLKLGGKIASGDVDAKTIQESTPFLSVLLPARLAVQAVEGD
jgi:hypothetical protein